ncbi:MAG TPA: hypothetical protein VMQ62_08505 [Dongiaceae bacterium]|nr:hypothetical protein [Dongiaceae bacterium]
MSHDRLVLTLPPEPALARLTRLVTLHFLRQQGVKAGEARLRAKSVETRARAVLTKVRKAASVAAGRGRNRPVPGPAPAPLSITMVSRARACEVVLKPPKGASARLLLVPRTVESR